MRITMAAAAGVAVFFGTACGNGGTSSGATGDEGSTGNSPATTGGSGTSSGGNGAGTVSGTTTGPSGFADGTACSSNDACLSGVCGLNGSGNCCTTACKTDNTACAAAACDNTGACTYPKDGNPCNSTCQYGLFTSYKCGGGACSPAAPVACPNNLACNAAGTACAGSCDPANGNGDCALGWYCAGSICTPQVQLGACTSNAECQSNVCGVTGTGHCCTQSACTNVNSVANPCGTLDCDGATGECTFPSIATICDTGAISCKQNAAGVKLNVQLDPNTKCDGDGTCQPPIETDCSPYACESQGCVTSCDSIADCDKDFWCNNGVCIPQQAVGACSENDTCLSLQCGSNGVGHCCFQSCGSTDPSCGITDCDKTTGACGYPTSKQACGSILESCANNTQQNPSVCNGQGDCPAPGTTACAPFVCGANACKTSCSSNSDCVAGAACAVSAGICCPALLAGASLSVDSQTGSDTAACCGQNGYTACGTIAHAMSLIDTAQATGVTINVSIGGPGSGGQWSGESYPIKLGWGVELNAGGINFSTGYWYNNYNNYTFTCYTGLFDIAQYSANDTTGYASIVGTAALGNVLIGYDVSYGTYAQCNDYGIQIEDGQHLYLANAQVSSGNDIYYYTPYTCSNGTCGYQGMAVNVMPGGSLTLAKDQSATVTGQVVIGTTDTTDNYERISYKGVVCNTDGTGKGCNIDDFSGLDAGPSVIFQNNQFDDLEANDFSTIALNGSPQFGSPPATQGIHQCSYKVEGANNYIQSGAPSYPIILLNGNVSMSVNHGLVACLNGDGFVLNPSSFGNAGPSLLLNGTTIENTEYAIYAKDGTVAGKNNNIVYNWYGVVQDGTAQIDLSNGGNTVACTSSIESQFYINYNGSCQYDSYYCANPSAAVVDLGSNDLDADNVTWDIKGPDIFSCTDSTLTSCTCETASGNCTVAGGTDGMDAVYTTGGTTTANNGSTWAGTCTIPTTCDTFGTTEICSSGQVCCDFFYGEYTECLVSSECPGGEYEYD